jgi:excisionase family DNA binding protein
MLGMYNSYRLPILCCSLTTMSTETRPELELWTIAEVAKFLKLSIPTVRRLQQQRHIAFVKIGGRIRFTKSDIMSYLKTRRVSSVDQKIYGSKKN